MQPINVLLVDNSVSFLDLLEHYFAHSPNIRVVGRARSGAEAIEKLSQVQAEVVLMDMTMPGLDGLETTRRIRCLPQSPHVVMMTGNDGPEYAVAALEAGAHACVCKSDFFTQIHAIFEQIRDQSLRTSEASAPRADAQLPERVRDNSVSDRLVHDLNNLLTKITGYAELTLRSLPANHVSQPWLREIQAAVLQASQRIQAGTEPIAPIEAAPAAPAAKAEPARGGETILVVEDDEALLVYACRVLSAKGYVVLKAKHGRDADRICREHVGPIHLAITDQNLVNMKGSEVVGLMRAARPDLRVLFMSGASEASVARSLGGAECDFLAKPFTPAAIANKVREVLDRAMEVRS